MGRGITLAVLAAAAAALATALFWGDRDGEASTRRLLPDFEPSAVVAIEIERPGAELVRLEREGEGGAFSLAAPRPGPADADAARELLGALEMLSYQRRGDQGRGLEQPRADIRAVADDGRSWDIQVGDAIEVSDQVWIGREGEAFIAEGYFARQLVLTADDLRERRPFRDIASADELTIEAGDAAISVGLGAPLYVELPAGAARASEADVAALLRDLRRLRLDANDAAAGEAPGPSLRIDAGEAELEVTGRCASGDARVKTQLGVGCVNEDELEAIAERARDAYALVDRRLLDDRDGDIETVSIREGDRELALRRSEAGYVAAGGAEVEAREVRRFVRELAAATGEVREVSGEARELSRVDIERDGAPDDAITVIRDAAGLLAVRAGEPVGLALPNHAEGLVRADPLSFRPRRLIAREPHAIRELARRDGGRELAERVRRGQLVGEHIVAYPEGAAPRSAAIAEAAEVIARLRADSYEAGEPAPRHGLAPPRFAVEAVFDPPPLAGAEAETHVIAVGADAPGGCYARVDDGPVAVLPRSSCEALTAPWTDRP